MLLASTLALFELSNPIYVIVLLIVIFLLGSFLLLFFQYQYFALLYMVVYVGAILVLFLFVIMMLEIRQLNIQQSFLVFINQKNWILLFIFILFFYVFNLDNFDLSTFFLITENNASRFSFFSESNLYVPYDKFLSRIDNLRGIGLGLFLEYKLAVILAGVLLLVSMIGSIVLTMGTIIRSSLKIQAATPQALHLS